MTYRLPRVVHDGHDGRAGFAEPVDGHHDLSEVLAAVRQTAADLLATSPTPPSTLNVRAGGVSVEMGWAPAPGTVAVAQADGSVVVAATTAAPAAPAVPAGELLTAATVGVFYRAASPGSPPFVSEGDEITPGQQVAIIEAMKLMLPVEADRGGRVAEVLVVDGEAVEYGQPLFRLAAQDEVVVTDQAA